MEMFYSIIKPAEGETEDDKSSDDDEAMKSIELTMIAEKNQQKTPALKDKATKIQSKIKSVAKILKLQKILREKSEEVINKKPIAALPANLGPGKRELIISQRRSVLHADQTDRPYEREETILKRHTANLNNLVSTFQTNLQPKRLIPPIKKSLFCR